MKAVIADVPQHLLDSRARNGADQWDEMWEGVLHMPPAPNREHQGLEWELETWLRLHWARPNGARAYHQINVASPGGWPNDYRIPDLVLLAPDRFHVDRNEYFEGAPTVVVEIHSPDDEACEKLVFYAGIGVPEVWIVPRDTKRPELYVLQGTDYAKQAPAADGWLDSPATAVRLRGEQGNKLGIQLAGDEATRRSLPGD